MRTTKPKQEDLTNDLIKRQQNIVWPGPLRNSRGVDEFFWKGSSNPTGVQQVAAALFGLFFVIAAVAFAAVGAERHSVWGLLSFVLLLYGGKILFNALPKKTVKPDEK